MEKISPGAWLALEHELLKTEVLGEPFINLTAYKGIALWWFIRFRLFNPEQSTTLVRIPTRNPYLFSIFEYLYDLSTSFICRMLLRCFRQKATKKPSVLITVHDRDWRDLSSPSGSTRKGDFFFHSIISELQRRGYRVITTTHLKMNLFSGLKTMIGRLINQHLDLVHKELNAYWTMDVWRREYYAKKHFRNIWVRISKDEKLISVLKKSGLENELPHYFNSIFGYVVKCLEMSKRIVNEENPGLILVSSEHGIIEKSLIVAGKLKKIPTLAIQHGTIGHIHKGYLCSRGSISESGSAKTPFCPIPDKTALFGPYYHDLLTKIGNYPANSIVVTGQPRYDDLVMASKLYDRSRFCERLNLDPNKKIVLVVTENVPISNGKVFLINVMRALREFQDLQIIVKPHPAERGEWYKEVIKNENIRAVVLPKNADIYEALYACDLFVADFSTVILEAVILKKLGVTVHLSKRKDPTPYFKEVTLRVYNKEDLAPAIRALLEDEKTRERLRKAMDVFLSAHVYKLDGKSTERVVDLVEEMMKEK